MKAFLTLAVIVFAAFGYFNYFGGDSPKEVSILGSSVSVDAGDFVAEFSISKDFQETYMLFGGDHIKTKNIINSIVLSGLEIADTKSIYARYPDFYLCSSAGSSIAKHKVKQLNLIPPSKQVFRKLNALVKEHKENFAKGLDRVCATITGKTLSLKSSEVEGKNSTEERRVIHQIPPGPFYLVNFVERVECKPLLDEASEKKDAPKAKSPAEEVVEFIPKVFKEVLSSGELYEVPNLYTGVSLEPWDPPPEFSFVTFHMVDNNFVYDLAKNRIYDTIGGELIGEMWLYTKKGVDSNEMASLRNSFGNYYTQELAKLGWVQYIMWNDQKFDFISIEAPHVIVDVYGKQDGEDLRFIMLEQHFINAPSCPCELEQILFVSDIYKVSDVFPY